MFLDVTFEINNTEPNSVSLEKRERKKKVIVKIADHPIYQNKTIVPKGLGDSS